jgi:hypothetical protein
MRDACRWHCPSTDLMRIHSRITFHASPYIVWRGSVRVNRSGNASWVEKYHHH